MMARPCKVAVVTLLVVFLMNTECAWAKKSGGGSSSKKTSSSNNKSGTQTKPSSSQPGNYPRQPTRNSNPYPPGGSYPHPGAGNTNPGGYPRQNPGSYPGTGNNPNPAGGNPGGYPAGGGYPNQYPGRAGTNQGGYPNQYPAGGGYPAAGGYPNQYPGRGGTYQGGYPNQYPAGGGYPGAGGYPVRGGNTGQGWGQPGGYPNSYPGGGGGYSNWNPNNQILSPRLGGGGYGHGGYGMGGSPFSHSVQNMGYKPKSSGFAKKAMVAAGVGAVAGMAVGYGLGRFPRPHFNFRTPEEQYYYNNYMYRHYGSRSTDEKDFGRDYEYRPPPRAETYEKFMGRCINRTDLLKDQSSSSPTSESDNADNDTVGIEEIGYPALIEQMKTRRCVELYMAYSERFLEERKAEEQIQPNSRSSPLSSGIIQLFTSLFMLLSSLLLLQ